MPIQFCDNHVNNNRTSGLHLCNGRQENIPTHWLINPNNWIENVSLRWIISHVKCKGICTSAKVDNPILGDGGKTIVHNITKDLKMFMLVISHNIKIHHEEINLTYFYSWHKITNENIPFISKFD
jgi:hypothetical protein